MNRLTRHLWAGLILVVALLSVGRTSVGACSCAGRGGAACQTVWNSEAVFVATVASIGPVVAGDRVIGSVHVGWDERVIALKVTEAFRGVESGDLTVRTAASSASCGFRFEEGRAYVVFADRDTRSGAWSVSYCSSTAPVEESAEALAYLRGPFRVPSDAGVVRGIVSHFEQFDRVDHPAPSTPFAGAELRLEGFAQAYTTTSGSDGAYSFRVPAGDYRLFARVRDGVYASTGDEGYSVLLKDNRGCAVANVTVRPDSRIAGRVLNSEGQPVPFMSVDLVPVTGDSSERLFYATQTLTDARGRFEFSRIDPGQYAPGLVLPRDTGEGEHAIVWLDREGSGQPVAAKLAPEERLQLGDIRLPSGVSTVLLQGRVVDTAGQAVEGASVRFAWANPKVHLQAAPTLTGTNGRFSLTVIAGHTFRLRAEWRSDSPGAVRYLFAESDAFEAAGSLKPFRLVLSSR